MRRARLLLLAIACAMPSAPALAAQTGNPAIEPDFSAMETVQDLPQEYDAGPGSDVDGPMLLAQPFTRNYAPRQQFSGGGLGQQMGCLAEAVYFEARGEPLEGQ